MHFDHFARQAFATACDQVLPEGGASHGDASNGETLHASIAAVVAFHADGIDGTLGIAADEVGARRLMGCFPIGDDSDVDAGDVLGELANLVLGIVRQIWTTRGVNAFCTTPVVLRGVDLRVVGDPRRLWMRSDSIESGSGFTTWMEIDVAQEPELLEVAPSEDDPRSDAPLVF
ncbi:MAG: hypothetical protein R3F34_05140 [Planctomycetota bacterium]